MDPITQAIVFGIAGNFATEAIKAAYNAFHNAIASKFGLNSRLVEAINELKANPNVEGQKLVLQGQVMVSKANEDPHLVTLAEHVIKLAKEQQPGGQQVITQKADNVENSAMSGIGNATVNKTTPGK